MPRRDDDSDLDWEPRPRRRRARRKSNIGPVLILVCVGIGLLILAAAGVGAFLLAKWKAAEVAGVAAGPAESDLDRLAGTWESTFRDPAGQVTMRKVKAIAGNTETATWYRADGSVFRMNRVQFQLDVRGRDKVFRYFNGVVLVGPDVGQPFPGGEYAYTLEGDTWTEFEPSGGIIVWSRQR
jgi:hypothetical protein